MKCGTQTTCQVASEVSNGLGDKIPHPSQLLCQKDVGRLTSASSSKNTIIRVSLGWLMKTSSISPKWVFCSKTVRHWEVFKKRLNDPSNTFKDLNAPPLPTNSPMQKADFAEGLGERLPPCFHHHSWTNCCDYSNVNHYWKMKTKSLSPWDLGNQGCNIQIHLVQKDFQRKIPLDVP